MARIFRAFLWMRWRVLVNSLERTGARDTLERFAVATEKLGPIVALVLLIPTSIALFVLGIVSGFGLGTGDWPIPIEVIRYVLLLALALTFVGPVILSTRDSGSVVRLLLLPISRFHLYLGQMAGTIADPWILLIVPLVLGVAIGLVVALKFLAGVVALCAGLAFLLFVMGLSSLMSSVVHLLLRDRRRGDVVMLVLVFAIPLVAMAPQILLRSDRQQRGRMTRAERAALPPSRTAVLAARLMPFAPSEMYRRATMAASTAPTSAALPLVSLALLAVGVQAAGFAVYRRVLNMPVSVGTRRSGSFSGLWTRTVPGLSPAASAVAFTQLRLGLRTPRGRACIAAPLVMPIILGAIAYQSGRVPLPGIDGHVGLGLAAFGMFASILALLPLAMNQFAIDKGGFTRQMLSPLSVRELLLGKAVGNAFIAAIPAACSFVIPALMFGGGGLGLWVALPLAVIATYVLSAPAAAAVSAILPKASDLNSIGTSSNPHQGANLLGMLSIAGAAAPSALLVLFAARVLHRTDLALLLVGAWSLLALALSYAVFIPVARLVESRRESLAQYY